MKIKVFLLSSVLILIALMMQGQDNTPLWQKLRYLSEEEMHQEFDFKTSFAETDPPQGPVRNVAEYDQMQSVLIRYPFGIPMTLIREMADNCEVITLVASESQKETVLAQYTSNDVNLENCAFLITPTDSYWTRDYGPWFVFDGNNHPGIVDFPYNRPRPNDNNVPSQVAEYLNIDLYGMILETAGGNYMTDGLGRSSSTELIYEENPQLTVDDVDSIVQYFLGIEDYYVIDDPLDDYIKHIDCWGKFLSPGKVLIGEVPETDYRYDDFEAAADFFKNEISAWGKPYEVVRVFTPGGNPSTPYTNSLILNNHVFLPITGSQWDDEAIAVYEEAMPGYVIHPILHNNWQNTDALHCRTKGIADLGMLYIEHMPLLGTVGFSESYDFTANITAANGEDIYSDSVLIYYSVNGGEFMVNMMEHQDGTTWTGTITGLEAGDQIDYYLFAADESGRRSFHPFIGQPDPHEFNVFGIQTADLTLNPDTLLFINYDDLLGGLNLSIINISTEDVEIEYITPGWDEWESDFNWEVHNMPDLPYTLSPQDSLTVLVTVGIPVGPNRQMLMDTLFVNTSTDSYYSLVMVDSDLVGMEKQKFGPEIEVFPNPFNSQLNFNFQAEAGENVILTIFGVDGKMVYQEKKLTSAGLNQMIWETGQAGILPGMYLYELRTSVSVKTGKVIFKD